MINLRKLQVFYFLLFILTILWYKYGSVKYSESPTINSAVSWGKIVFNSWTSLPIHIQTGTAKLYRWFFSNQQMQNFPFWKALHFANCQISVNLSFSRISIMWICKWQIEYHTRKNKQGNLNYELFRQKQTKMCADSKFLKYFRKVVGLGPLKHPHIMFC